MGIFGSLYWDTYPFTSRDMGYLVPPIQASLMSGLSYYKPEASSTMRALASARCTDARLYTYRIKIGTSQRAPGEHSHY